MLGFAAFNGHDLAHYGNCPWPTAFGEAYPDSVMEVGPNAWFLFKKVGGGSYTLLPVNTLLVSAESNLPLEVEEVTRSTSH